MPSANRANRKASNSRGKRLTTAVAEESDCAEWSTDEGDSFTVAEENPEGRYECVTCGCPAAHALKFKSGGLTQISSKIDQLTRRLESVGLPSHEVSTCRAKFSLSCFVKISR